MIEITFKTPDVLDSALEGLSSDEAADLVADLSNWIKYGEYVTLQYDPVTKTMSVKPAGG